VGCVWVDAGFEKGGFNNMNFYSWWTEASEEVLGCPDKLKLIRVLVRQEMQLREILGYKKLPQEKINKLIALLELKYLLEQKLSTTENSTIQESLIKCSEELSKIRIGELDNFHFLDEKLPDSCEHTEFLNILNSPACTSPIISKLYFS
jgi:hypothetical protein